MGFTTERKENYLTTNKITEGITGTSWPFIYSQFHILKLTRPKLCFGRESLGRDGQAGSGYYSSKDPCYLALKRSQNSKSNSTHFSKREMRE